MFDKSKPFGEVSGTGVAFKYTQDGKYYLMNGTEVNEAGNKKRTAPVRNVKPTLVQSNDD